MSRDAHSLGCSTNCHHIINAQEQLTTAADCIQAAATLLGGHKRSSETNHRFSSAMMEILGGYEADAQVEVHFDEGADMVIVRDIPFFALCEHHLLPFFGKAHVALIPSTKVPGLSKYARLVEKHARRLTLQERISQNVADELHKAAKAKGVMVVLEGQHMCMSMRGVKAHEASTTTSAIRGTFKENHASRQEALTLLLRKA